MGDDRARAHPRRGVTRTALAVVAVVAGVVGALLAAACTPAASDAAGITAQGGSLVVLHVDGVAETRAPDGTVTRSVATGW